MKIPSKNIVNSQIAEQRRQHVLEGVQIAKKIDVLRESQLFLENKQHEFIENSKKELEKELSGLYSERDRIKKEIEDYEKKYKGLTKVEIKKKKDIERGLFLQQREKEAEVRLTRLTLLSNNIIEKITWQK